MMIIIIIFVIALIVILADKRKEKFNTSPGLYRDVFLNRKKFENKYWPESRGFLGETLYSGYPPAYSPFVNFN